MEVVAPSDETCDVLEPGMLALLSDDTELCFVALDDTVVECDTLVDSPFGRDEFDDATVSCDELEDCSFRCDDDDDDDGIFEDCMVICDEVGSFCEDEFDE